MENWGGQGDTGPYIQVGGGVPDRGGRERTAFLPWSLRSEDIILGIRCYIRTHTMLSSPFREDYKFTSGGWNCVFLQLV